MAGDDLQKTAVADLGAVAPVLIANRGEIAVRIARTVRALGLSSIAVFTDADIGSLHIESADQAVRISSYLAAGEIVESAKQTGARSVHPGYGFLSENAAFAQAVIDARLTWIGPPPAAIELMGDKGSAKGFAERAGVPIVPPGDDGQFPVVVKAVAGGGGKGMRVVRAAEELAEATAAAEREALAAFGDGRVIVERWIERPRHIEIQVFADAHGNVLHFGERECSLQRRHQKVVEECPSPAVDDLLRQRMGTAATALARACDYVGAGTVEFVTSGDVSEFFFLEMNTRLQVEHPVTELVYGLDLVELQLRVAAGERLPMSQEQIVPVGHAIEARLYAEDPARGFLPSTGTVRHYRAPEHARVDSALRVGLEIGTAFDPMLGKVIAHGVDRQRAIDKLDRALAELELLGVTTNASFVRTLLARTDIRRGEQDTGLLERVLADPDLSLQSPPDLLPAAALAAAGTAQPEGPWWRAFERGEVRIADGYVTAGETTWEARIHPPTDGDAERMTIELDGVARHYAVVCDGDEAVWITRAGHQLQARTLRPDRSGAAVPKGSLEAPMPGTVLQVRVQDGDTVTAGDVLVILESMKMELVITAPTDGVVSGLTLSPGDRVELGQPLVAIAPAEAEEAAQ
ncbi:MAG TPA: biotin carboxylase N-terminal domain-containing protein [Solirubrobacteraceae bacterium]|jgi:acetyl-CoA/propionyl-CoA carboxylase biotin carboxyl carrier protein|nr:biotin carboxylase N-terminal domain-containing protein [Solirubrobacteraceae bacterium]